MEEVRMITNLVRNGQPRVRLVLAGSSVLEERFARPDSGIDSASGCRPAVIWKRSIGPRRFPTFDRKSPDWVGTPTSFSPTMLWKVFTRPVAAFRG